ncbi:MAG: hypothetical protein FD123_106 [Bacteroidetes bacterium]|nr:MAG: hypothetical protein FD123_106 [Bacteroidota bacterium]
MRSLPEGEKSAEPVPETWFNNLYLILVPHRNTSRYSFPFVDALHFTNNQYRQLYDRHIFVGRQANDPFFKTGRFNYQVAICIRRCIQRKKPAAVGPGEVYFLPVIKTVHSCTRNRAAVCKNFSLQNGSFLNRLLRRPCFCRRRFYGLCRSAEPGQDKRKKPKEPGRGKRVPAFCFRQLKRLVKLIGAECATGNTVVVLQEINQFRIGHLMKAHQCSGTGMTIHAPVGKRTSVGYVLRTRLGN